jgi:hypothetical protein
MVRKKKGSSTNSALDLAQLLESLSVDSPLEQAPESPPAVAPTKKAYEPVEESLECSISYSEGVPRRHHNFFVDTGDFFLQVSNM